MGRVARWAVIAGLAASAAGCGFGGRPYADDPLLRSGRGVRGDATRLTSLLPSVLHGQVALVVTSPPYGPTVHGLVRPTPGSGVVKSDNRYGDDKGVLGN